MKVSSFLLIWSFSFVFSPAQKIEVDYQKTVDFSRYETYAWAELERIPIIRAESGTEEVLSDRELDELIRRLVEGQLAKKGFRKAQGETPDFLVSYLAAARYDFTSRGIDAGASGYPGLPDGHWRPFYDQPDSRSYALIRLGTLAIDVVDTESKVLAWRGTAEQTFDRPEQIPKKLDKVVKKIIKKFPPK